MSGAVDYDVAVGNFVPSHLGKLNSPSRILGFNLARTHNGRSFKMKLGASIKGRLKLSHWRKARQGDFVAVNADAKSAAVPRIRVTIVIAGKIQYRRIGNDTPFRDLQSVAGQIGVKLSLIQTFAVRIQAVTDYVGTPSGCAKVPRN